MLREFSAELQKSGNKGAWTYVVMDGSAELFGTRGLVKAAVREAIGKSAGDTVRVRLDERIA